MSSIMVMGVYARWWQRQSHSRWHLYSWASRLAETFTLSLQHPFFILDTHVMVRWHLSKQDIHWPVSHDHIEGSSLELIKFMCFFEVDGWSVAGFFIGLRAHVRVTCCKQGWVVWKPVNANPGKLIFSCIQIFFTAFVLLFWGSGDYSNYYYI